ncbi:Acetolactate synthase, mitochondrial [Tephrocybe rancida]|nr:Acetolactate synthase, mitochondrial [Tephrocybe rancida]
MHPLTILSPASRAEIFHHMMLLDEVKHIFGHPGSAILPVFDVIYKSEHLDFVFPRHESGAGHMAEGYARISGKPGAVLVTSGPRAADVVTPIQDTLSDGIPIIVFTGQVATSAIGSDAFHCGDGCCWYLSQLHKMERYGQQYR